MICTQNTEPDHKFHLQSDHLTGQTSPPVMFLITSQTNLMVTSVLAGDILLQENSFDFILCTKRRICSLKVHVQKQGFFYTIAYLSMIKCNLHFNRNIKKVLIYLMTSVHKSIKVAYSTSQGRLPLFLLSICCAVAVAITVLCQARSAKKENVYQLPNI